MNNNISAESGSSRHSINIYLKGFAMGIADIIPGVSGGTIAFITGIYQELLNSISALDHHLIKLILKFDFKQMMIQLNAKFMIPLMLGIFSAIISTSRLVHFLLANYPEATWSTFLGLIAASIFVIGKKIQFKNAVFQNIAASIIGIGFGYSLVSLIPLETPNELWFIFLCGMIAITAMILPGISGSFILVIFGKYAVITGALKNPLNFENIKTILVFGLGALSGLISFSKLLKFLLHKYESIALAFLTGLMVGSIKKIWPWKQVLETQQIGKKLVTISEKLVIPAQFNAYVLLCFLLIIIGAVSVYQLEKLSDKS